MNNGNEIKYNECHFIMIKDSLRKITVLNVFAVNNRASKYMKIKLIEPQEN
jgi:hypothetical protein